MVEGVPSFGAKAIMNIWEPHVQSGNYSSTSELWIASGSSASDLNAIIVGWHVSFWMHDLQQQNDQNFMKN